MEKSKLLKNTQRYRKTPKGVLTNMYSKMKSRNDVEFSLKEFHEMYLNDKKFLRLHGEWVKSKFSKQLKPSIDRIDCKKPYLRENINMLTWAENRYKQSKIDGKRGRKPRVYQKLNGKIIRIFQCQRQVVKELGISQPNLSSVLNGRRKYVGGYNFEYESIKVKNEE